jgi:DNA polymerase IV
VAPSTCRASPSATIPRDVQPNRAPKSIGSESTFDHDLVGPDPLREPILRHCEEVARRLRAEGYRARVLVLKIKRGDHSLITRRSVAKVPLLEARELNALAIELLERIPLDGARTRLVGVSAASLEPLDPPQQSLFPEDGEHERPQRLGAVLDAIEGRFGRDVIRRAGS